MALKTLLVPEDVGALYLGPSFLTADPMVPLLDQDEEEALSLSSSLEESSPASPSPTLSSPSLSPSPYQTLCSSPLSSSFSPPASPLSYPSSFLGSKVGADGLSLSRLGAAELLHAHVGADAGRDDPFSGMDWMPEKIDLSDFDLDSLMDSCSSDEPPSSPEDLFAILDSQMDLDPFDSPIPSQLDALALPLPLPDLLPLPLEPPPVTLTVSPTEEEQQAVVMVKTEPLSPPPLYHLELGSEVDVLEVDKNASTLNASVMSSPTGGLPTPTTTSFLVSLTNAGPYVVLFTAKAEPGLIQESAADKTPPAEEAFPLDETFPTSSDSDSDSGIESASSTPPRISSPSPSSPSPSSPSPSSPSPSSPSPSSPSSSAGSSRTKPYSRPEPARADRKSAGGGAPPRVVEKKLKKMEQNKTAATRYRQKKRVEQEVLSGECDELETKNHELAEKVDALSREIKYLKDLMEEVRNAKNRRSKTVSA